MYQWRIRSNLPALQDTHNSGGVPVCLFPPRLACCYQPEEIQYLAVSLDGYFHHLKIQLVQQYNHKEILAQPTNGHNNNKRLITCKRFISLVSIFVKKKKVIIRHSNDEMMKLFNKAYTVKSFGELLEFLTSQNW